jgi:hypothetical protein
VTDGPPDAPAAPALKALGGWTDASWFCPSVLTESDVVGFQLPAIPGVRKQKFQVIDRSVGAAKQRAPVEKAPAKPPKTLTGKLANILETYGVTKAVACCRSRFLFESAPILFFAAMPAAKLKARAVAKLRRELIDSGLRACVLRAEPGTITAMFWPASEDAITSFVQAAQPDRDLHGDFDKSPAAAPAGARAPGAASDNEKKLLREVTALRQQVESLQRSQSVLGAMEKLGLDDARLKSMLTLLHPDKHANSQAATEAAQWLNNLRELLKAK